MNNKLRRLKAVIGALVISTTCVVGSISASAATITGICSGESSKIEIPFTVFSLDVENTAMAEERVVTKYIPDKYMQGTCSTIYSSMSQDKDGNIIETWGGTYVDKVSIYTNDIGYAVAFDWSAANGVASVDDVYLIATDIDPDDRPIYDLTEPVYNYQQPLRIPEQVILPDGSVYNELTSSMTSLREVIMDETSMITLIKGFVPESMDIEMIDLGKIQTDTIAVKGVNYSSAFRNKCKTAGYDVLMLPDEIKVFNTADNIGGEDVFEAITGGNKGDRYSTAGDVVIGSYDNIVMCPANINPKDICAVKDFDDIAAIESMGITLCNNTAEKKVYTVINAKSINENAFNNVNLHGNIVIGKGVKSLLQNKFNIKPFDEDDTLTFLNPDCEISIDCDKLNIKTISGYTDSTAEAFAEENNLVFTAIDAAVNNDILADGKVEASMYGDINGDEDVNVSDVVLLNKYNMSSTLYPLNAQCEANADVYKDGVIDTLDTSLLMNYTTMLVGYDRLGAER